MASAVKDGIHEYQKEVARKVMNEHKEESIGVEAGVVLIHAYYDRACACNKRFEEISFKEYAAMLLKACESNIFGAYKYIFDELVKDYGLKDGLKGGMTYIFEDDSLNEEDEDDSEYDEDYDEEYDEEDEDYEDE